ncbi:MAG: hypothetical protein HY958_07870 [Bacteroidia bacterium]|nr:hypothetical protein [Bacteroidia bacterium]
MAQFEELKVKASEDVYILSEFQKQRIDKGREQRTLGQTVSQEDLQKEIDQWLSVALSKSKCTK